MFCFQDRRILFNAVKQQCLSMLMKPLVDKQSTLCHRLDSLNAYELDERRLLSEELNQLEIEMQTFKENPSPDSTLFASRNRNDIDWVYISIYSFNAQRDPSDCKFHWQNFLHPWVNKESWSTDEVNKLFEVVSSHQVC